MAPKARQVARRARRANNATTVATPHDIAVDNLPCCEQPGCQNRAMPIADDFFREMDSAVIAIVRNGVTFAVGKFTGCALTRLMEPGDVLYFNDSREVIFQGPASSSDEESAEES